MSRRERIRIVGEVLGGDRAREIQNKGPATPPTTAATKANRGCVRSGEDQATQAEGEGSDRGNSRPRSRYRPEGRQEVARVPTPQARPLQAIRSPGRRVRALRLPTQRDEVSEQFDRPVQERRRCPYRLGYARNSLTCVHIRGERARIGQCRAGNQHHTGARAALCTTDEDLLHLPRSGMMLSARRCHTGRKGHAADRRVTAITSRYAAIFVPELRVPLHLACRMRPAA